MNPFSGRLGRLEFFGLTLLLAGSSLVLLLVLLPNFALLQDPYAALPSAAQRFFPSQAVLPLMLIIAFLSLGHALFNIFSIAAVLFVLITLAGVRADFADLFGLQGSAWLSDAILVGLVLMVVNAIALALMAQRCHDMGFTAWRTLVTLIPFIGPMWMVLDLCIMAGDEHANIYDEA